MSIQIKPIHVSIVVGIILSILHLVGAVTLIRYVVDPYSRAYSYSSSRNDDDDRDNRQDRRKSEGYKTRQRIRMIGETVEKFKSMYGGHPNTDSIVDLMAYFQRERFIDDALRKILDEWGEILAYEVSEYDSSNSYIIVSSGPNKVFDKTRGDDDIIWRDGRFIK